MSNISFFPAFSVILPRIFESYEKYMLYMGTKSISTFFPLSDFIFNTHLRILRLIVLWWGALKLPYPLKLKFCKIRTLIRRFQLFYSQNSSGLIFGRIILFIGPLWADNNFALKKCAKVVKIEVKGQKCDILYKIRL